MSIIDHLGEIIPPPRTERQFRTIHLDERALTNRLYLANLQFQKDRKAGINKPSPLVEIVPTGQPLCPSAIDRIMLAKHED